MERYQRVFRENRKHYIKEGVLAGNSILKFKGNDEISNFWVVLYPTKGSDFVDICFEASVLDVAIQVKGGLKGSEIEGFYKSEKKATKIAQELLGE